MQPENQPLEKEIPFGNHHFQVPFVKLWGCTGWGSTPPSLISITLPKFHPPRFPWNFPKISLPNRQVLGAQSTSGCRFSLHLLVPRYTEQLCQPKVQSATLLTRGPTILKKSPVLRFWNESCLGVSTGENGSDPNKYHESPKRQPHHWGRGFVRMCSPWSLRFGHSDRSSLEDPKIQSEILDPPRGCQMDGSWGATLFNPLGFKHHPLDGAGTFMVGVFFDPFQNEHIPTPGLLLISQCFCGFGGLGMNLSNLVTLEKKTPRKNSLTFLHLFHEITSKVLFCRYFFSDVCQVEHDGFQRCLKMLKKTPSKVMGPCRPPQRWPHQPDRDGSSWNDGEVYPPEVFPSEFGPPEKLPRVPIRSRIVWTKPPFFRGKLAVKLR